jgi:hypothetical protein
MELQPLREIDRVFFTFENSIISKRNKKLGACDLKHPEQFEFYATHTR